MSAWGAVSWLLHFTFVKAAIQAKPDADIRLFEGFVSYKKTKKKRTHCEDAALLREVVDNPGRYSTNIVPS